LYIVYSILFYCILVYAALTLLAQIFIYCYIIQFLYFGIVCIVVKLIDIIALLELET
jgi:hypothetical protein